VEYVLDGEDWFGFRAVRPVAGNTEILMIPLPGHTRGHVGVAVATDNGWLLHAGDAYFDHRQLADHPTCPPGLAAFQRILQTDRRARRENVEHLREVNRRPDITVFSAHSSTEFDRFRHR
jgi:glyoxylase-like metal-dependent hydrolase (beta-lactamase superfamily II)